MEKGAAAVESRQREGQLVGAGDMSTRPTGRRRTADGGLGGMRGSGASLPVEV